MFRKSKNYFIAFLFVCQEGIVALNASYKGMEGSSNMIQKADNKNLTLRNKINKVIKEDVLGDIISFLGGIMVSAAILNHGFKVDGMILIAGSFVSGMVCLVFYAVMIVILSSDKKEVSIPEKGVVRSTVKGGQEEASIPNGYVATLLDLIILLLLLLFAYRGFTNGLIAQFFSTGATLGMLVGGKSIFLLMKKAAHNLWPGLDEAVLPFVGFALLLIFSLLVIYVTEKILNRILKKTILGYFDSILGGILGVIQASFCISALIWVLALYEIELPDSYVENMRLYQAIATIVPKCIIIVNRYIPTDYLISLLPDKVYEALVNAQK